MASNWPKTTRRFFSWTILTTIALVTVFYGPPYASADDPPKYPFKQSPLEIYDRLKDLKLGEPPAIPQAERELLAKHWRDHSNSKPVKITDDELRDLLIFASGIEKAEEVKNLQSAYDKLLTESKESLKDCKSAPDRAQELLTFLHSSAMKGGYELEKTTLAEVFAEHKFNCVSSTALYCLLGQAHGLKLQPIAVPGSDYQAGHATVDLIEDGKRIQIEPTNKDGYDWDTKLKQPGVISLNFGPKRETGHDVDLWTVPAMMYYNRGNRFKKPDASEQLMMIRCYIGAIALAPNDASAIKNMLSSLINWGPGLMEAGKYEEAVRVMDFAHEIAPEDSKIATNRRNAWQKQIMHLLESNQDAEAMSLAQKAITEFPMDSDFDSRVNWLEFLGNDLLKKNGYEAALAIMDRGEKVLNAEEMKSLLQWRTGITMNQVSTLLKQGDYPKSLEMLKRFYDSKSPDKELQRGIAYYTQESLALANQKAGISEAIAHYRQLRAAFPNEEEIPEVALSFAHRSLASHLKAHEYEKAASLVDQLMPLLESEKAKSEIQEQLCQVWISDLLKANQYENALKKTGDLARFLETEEATIELQERIYQHWIADLTKAENWEAAIAKARDAMKALPKSDRLKSQGVDIFIHWSTPSMNAKDWNKAIEVYERGLKEFPGDGRISNNLKYCKQQKAK